MTKKLFIIATGGTGGHVFPAQGFAEFLLTKTQKNIDIHFLIDTRGFKFLEKFLQQSPKNVGCNVVQSIGLKTGLVNKMRFLFFMTLGLIQSLYFCFYWKFVQRKYDEIFCIGFGGYSSFPAVIASKMLKIPVFLHQSDVIMGKANRFLKKFANRVFLGLSTQNYSITATNMSEKENSSTSNGYRNSVNSAEENESNDMQGFCVNQNNHVHSRSIQGADAKLLHVGIPVRKMFIDIASDNIDSNESTKMSGVSNLHQSSDFQQKCRLSCSASKKCMCCICTTTRLYAQTFNKENDCKNEFRIFHQGVKILESKEGLCENFISNQYCATDNLNEKVKILVIGGSQAASIWGEILPNAIALLPQNIKSHISIVQQTGELDISMLANKYTDAGMIMNLNKTEKCKLRNGCKDLKDIESFRYGNFKTNCHLGDVYQDVYNDYSDYDGYNTEKCNEIGSDIASVSYNSSSKIDISSTNSNVKLMKFIHDIADEIKDADIVFARAGASTIAECAYLNKPMLLLPYPFAAQNHQVMNAQYLQNNQASWYVEEKNLKPKNLAHFIAFYIQNKNNLSNMLNNLNMILPQNSCEKMFLEIVNVKKIL